MERSSTTYRGSCFLAWGYSTVIFSLLTYICLKLTANELYYSLYAGVPILANAVIQLHKKSTEKNDTEVFVDKVWGFFGILAVLLCVVRYYHSIHLFAFISFLMGLETIVTGVLIKRYTVSVLGLAGILGMVLLVFLSGNEQNLVISIVFLFIAVIPGYIINKSYSKN